MTFEQITDVFFWCSVINLGLLIFFALLFLVAGKMICRIHGKLWGIPEEKVRMSLYRVMATYKILVFVFCVIPYIALRIVA